jgi:integrase
MRAVEGSALHMPVVLACTCGLRRGEISAVRWKGLDLDNRILRVTQTLEETKAAGVSKEPKSERSRRTIALPMLAVEGLQQHRKQQAEALLEVGIRQTGDTLVCGD